ncbi:unnamed protein product [Bursaphelenchus xylophilus]|uniref:(pine wood nematode) hypothetical protein n=1 Tax=Bursaphelenchus xylophilus TaxID=6326 RepID=A0A1I7RS73_BURXY|nr:unnamed protein product [Bursaphelenchus xylophilus]CAG9123157.1 unnamed protein product [Bursaphelenchus xylophilus]
MEWVLVFCYSLWLATSAETLFNIVSGLDRLPREPGLIISSSMDLNISDFMNDMTINEQCHQRLEVGNGHMKLKRFFYNRQNDDCIPFIYRGNGGNLNNFLDENSCRITCILNFEKTDKCKNKPTSSCNKPKASGNQLFNYDVMKDECHPFKMNGCDKEDNFFVSKTECERKCVSIKKVPCLEIITCTEKSCPFTCLKKGDKQYCCNEAYKGP